MTSLRISQKLAAAAVVASVLLAAAGCTTVESQPMGQAEQMYANSASRDMARALAIAKLAETNTSTKEIQDEAKTVVAQLQAQIDELNTWKSETLKSAPMGEQDAVMATMPYRELKSTIFDQAWLQGIIGSYQSALVSVKSIVDSKNSKAKDFANKLISEYNDELKRLQPMVHLPTSAPNGNNPQNSSGGHSNN